MIKGAQRQMIVVKTPKSLVFEEAYFVVRPKNYTGSLDMLSEANKIIENCGLNQKKKRRVSVKNILFLLSAFLSGGTVGGVLVALIFSFA